MIKAPRHNAGTALAAVVAMTLCGCTVVGPNYTRPEVNIPVSYSEASTDAELIVPPRWWALYRDPTLDLLIDSGLAKNADVRLAIARMAEAEGLIREANATLLPQLDANAAIGRSQSSTRTGTLPPTAAAIRNNFSVSANTSFELDFWGRLSRGREAAQAQYAASRYGRDVVALTLAAGISQAYFSVRSLDAQIRVSEETLTASIESLDITRRRADAGFSSDLDVNQAQGNRAQLAAQIKELNRLRAVAIHQLGVLGGTPALELAAGDIWRLPVPPLPPAGLPSSLLERRPDLRQAEATLMAANAQIGVARAAQFPTFSLTGAVGAQSRELSTLFSAGAGIWSIGLGLVGPVLDWGRYAARTEQAEARAQQAAALYEKTAQTAFREVSDALSNVRHAGDSERDLTNRVEQSRNTLRLARMRYDAGYSAYLEVLDAQRTLNDAQLALARNRHAYLAYTVDLMNALGGGWTPY
ncbi:MAG: efflux transporter outer membrane subunit [Pseudomonadota bacterium]